MIPFPQGPHRLADEKSWLHSLVAALPRSYAVVFYSTDERFGWALLLLSLIVPWVGLAGLAGVVAAAGLAWILNVDRGWIRSGFALFNPLLACSAVVLAGRSNGWATEVIVLLWAAAVIMSLLLTVGLQGWVGSRLGLSVQSLPAVMVVVGLHWVGLGSGDQGPAAAAALWLQVDWLVLPDFLRAFFRAFAAMAFHGSDVAGILIYVAFVLSSPLGALMATIGYAAGAATLYTLGLPIDPLGTGWCGFNFLLAGVALGAGYQVPNRASLGLAVVGASLTAVAAVGLGVGLGWFRLSPGALPYNLVVLSMVAALRLLPRPAGLVISPWTTLQPEGTARLVQLNALRFPDYYQPALFLPGVGPRVITQGFDGDLTHRGAWRHGLDFEAPGGAGSWDAGSGDLREFAIYETPVYCPVSGYVVAVENQISDNPVGQNNPEANWGNYVIIRADAYFHVMLAHFLKGSVEVAVGQRVHAGDYLANCGNSGRSPVPHLHIQVQAGPLPGAPTLPFVMKHYVERETATNREIYHLSGVPKQGSVLRPAQPSAELHACFSGWLPGTYEYCNGDAIETIQMDFDEAGRFRLTSAERGESLTLYLAEGVLYATPFEGSHHGVLALLAVALARVPCISEPTVRWQEVVAAAPFLTRGRRAIHDLFDPFIGVEVLQYQYQVIEYDEQFEITANLETSGTKASPAALKTVRAVVTGRNGVVELVATTCAGEKLRIQQKKAK